MKKILLFALVIFGTFDFGFVKIAAAQPTKAQLSKAQLSKAHNTIGKIEFQESPDPTWSKLFETVSGEEKEFFRPFEKYMAKICSIVIDVAAVKPPKGFNIKPFVMSNSIKKSFRDYLIPPMEVDFGDFFFTINNETHQVVKQTIDMNSMIKVYLNDPKGLLNLDTEIRDNCEAAGIPLFYYKPKMHKDKNGFLVTKPLGLLTAVRVVKKKGIPLYTPVTQKEYLEYKIALAKKKLLSREEGMKKDKKKLQHLKFESNRAYFESSLKYDKQFIADFKKEIGVYKQALKIWPPEKLNAPAYTSDYYLPGKDDKLIDLVSAEDKGARELVRLNKEYFDKTLPRGVPQLISIGVNNGGRFSTPYEKKVLKAWFNGIDYAKLQAMIRE